MDKKRRCRKRTIKRKEFLMYSSGHVLVLDHRKSVLAGYIEFLEKNNIDGLQPYECPLSALTDIRAGILRPSIVIADEQMPDMTGLEFLARATDYYPLIRGYLLAACPEDFPILSRYSVIKKDLGGMREIVKELQGS
jgi:CheY-like chemotaxis protein